MCIYIYINFYIIDIKTVPSIKLTPFCMASLFKLTKSSPAFISAPLSNRIFRISAWSFTAATCNAVQPNECLTFTLIPFAIA